MVVVMVVVDQDNGGHGNMSPGQLSQVAGGRPLAHNVSGQLVHDGGHRWTSENMAGKNVYQWSLLVSISTMRWALDDIVYFYTHGL